MGRPEMYVTITMIARYRHAIAFNTPTPSNTPIIYLRRYLMPASSSAILMGHTTKAKQKRSNIVFLDWPRQRH